VCLRYSSNHIVRYGHAIGLDDCGRPGASYDRVGHSRCTSADPYGHSRRNDCGRVRRDCRRGRRGGGHLYGRRCRHRIGG